MQRRFIVSTVVATLVAVVGIYVNVRAVDTVASSDVPTIATQNTTQKSLSTDKPLVAKNKRQATSVTTSSTAAPTPTPSPSRAIVAQGDRLIIPAIGLNAGMINVGVTATNNIDVPADARVGRWIGSATPGTAGAVFLDGHVDGIFAGLHNVKTGQAISVQYGKKQYKYRVVFTETVPLSDVDMGKALSVYGGELQGLNIMTCAGKYDSAISTYDHRLVVYAVRDM